jgi:predicted histone-like DNA-binding protein
MAILFNKVERGNPLNLSAPKKWYPSLKGLGQTSEKEVARLIADETTLNPKEAEMALDQLRKVLTRELLNGRSVQLGDWGSFYLTCNGSGADSKEGVSAANIEQVNIRFTPGKALRVAVKGATFTAAESLVSGS